MSIKFTTNAAQVIKTTKKANTIFKDIHIYPYDCDMWHEFYKETGNWSIGIFKTAIYNDPNSYMLTSKDATILKEFLLNNLNFYYKYKL